MTACAADYAWQHPDPAAIRRAGYVGVLRYLSLDPSKNITPGEAGALHMVGLGIRLVWETTADRATQGTAAGQADAAAANAQADAVGYPRELPIFYAVDEQVDPVAVLPYFTGTRSGEREAIGVGPKGYGDAALCDSLAASGYGDGHWQTEAWSGTLVSAHAGLYQRRTPTLPTIEGAQGEYDEDAIVGPLDWWLDAPAPAPAPAPPAPLPPPPQPPPTNPWCPLAVDGLFGAMTTKALQWRLGVPTDGVFGPQSKRALQTLLHVAADGIVGPVTVRALQAHVGVAQDGVWGPVTTKGIQSALNAARF